jgi:hypothetical protein
MIRTLGLAVILAGFGAVTAWADSPALNNTALVRGGAPLPNFSTGFPIEIGAAPATHTPERNDLEISLTSSDHSVLRFLFSPRTVAGQTAGFGPAAGSNYSGLAWNLFDADRLFGNIALSGAVSRPPSDDPTRRLAGPVMSLHSTFELGYSFSSQQSLSFDIDHMTPAPYFGDRGAAGEDLRLRYGYHF